MSDESRRDPLDELRRANPAPADELPSASLARVRARIEEETSRDRPQQRRWWPSLVRPVGTGIAALVVVLLLAAGSLAPGQLPPPSGGGVAFCVEQYSGDTLRRRAVAFDGTVVAITGDNVTFEVRRAFRGIDGSTITLMAPGMTGPSVTSAGGPSFEVGRRYLVAGDGGFAWACGFSQPYDPDVAAEWERAFAR